MTRFRYVVLSFIGVGLMLYSCQFDRCGNSPSDLIDNMEDLVREADEADYEPKSEKWNTYDNRFKTYYEDCFEVWESEMTIGQKAEFAGLVTRYIANRFGKSFFRSIFDGNKDEHGEMEKFWEKLMGNE